MCGVIIAVIVLAAIVSAVFHVSVGWGLGITVGLLIVAGIVQARKPQTTKRTGKFGLVYSNVCPACRKHNKSRATVCRYCGTALVVPVNQVASIPPTVRQQSAATQKAVESRPTKSCPDCAETILAAARKCRYCGHEFADIPRGV